MSQSLQTRLAFLQRDLDNMMERPEYKSRVSQVYARFQIDMQTYHDVLHARKLEILSQYDLELTRIRQGNVVRNEPEEREI